MRRAGLGICVLLAVLAMVTGCRHSIGPKTVQRDQFDYAQALRDAGKEQMLLNMVGLRYSEAPMFLKVTSVINQYSLEGSVNLLSPPYDGAAAIGSPVGAGARFSDRPTRADLLLRLTVRSINGVTPASTVSDNVSDPRFFELVSLMSDVQRVGGLSFRIENRSGDEVAIVMIEHDVDDELQENRDRIDEILGIDPSLQEYRLVFGQQASGPGEIAMLTHSILEMLMELAMWIEVPPEHVASGRTRPTPETAPMEAFGYHPLIRVHSGEKKPDESFVAVRYDGLWFWINHEDFRSKRTIAFMQLMFSLAESGGGQQAPVVTVGAGGG